MGNKLSRRNEMTKPQTDCNFEDIDHLYIPPPRPLPPLSADHGDHLYGPPPRPPSPLLFADHGDHLYGPPPRPLPPLSADHGGSSYVQADSAVKITPSDEAVPKPKQPRRFRLHTLSQSDLVPDEYNMNHPKRGTAVIMNMTHFDPSTGMEERIGTDKDVEKMESLLYVLGFTNVKRHNDLTVLEIKAELKKVSNMDHSQSDCFVCVILSHGTSGGYVYAFDGKVPLDDLVYLFKGNQCPSLIGKPKIFFIQACRGKMRGRLAIQTMETDGGSHAAELCVPSEADFLMAYASVPGFVSWRDRSKGSWFIQTVVDVLQNNWKNMDLLSMMTKVNKKVAYDFEYEEEKKTVKQVPCITSMLTRKVYFTMKTNK